jgi:hypothetical protein
MKTSKFILLGFSLCLLTSCNVPSSSSETQTSSSEVEQAAGPVRSEIRLTEEGYRIYINDRPFYVKGAGLGRGDMVSLAQHGGNALRTWRARNGEAVLNQAQEQNLMVAMGLHVGLERHGFDYNDSLAVAAQLARLKETVKAFKDHPALFLWVIGNELNHHSENPKVWDAVNDIAKMIHAVDGQHLCTTPLAGMRAETVQLVQERASELDFISVQLYGEIEILPELIAASAYEGPLLVTEWGATGYWEVPTTKWGAPIENNSSVKADLYRSRYRKSIANQPQVMGSFAFLWGQKQERTPTWFGMFMPDGKESEAVDAMHYIWNNEWPQNRSPRLNDFRLDGKVANDNIYLRPGDFYPARVSVSDPDKDSLVFHWEILRESQSKATGGDPEEKPEQMEGLFQGPSDDTINFIAPSEAGAYRLFVYIADGHNHVAHANIPFYVQP